MLGDDLFENLINAAQPNSLQDVIEPPDKRAKFHSDHDYIAHKSPSEHSDSGISVVSDDSSPILRHNSNPGQNMTDDQLEFSISMGYSASYPDHDKISSLSLFKDSKVYDALMLDDISEINTTHSNTGNKLDDMEEYGYTGNDDDISIDFGMYFHLLLLHSLFYALCNTGFSFIDKFKVCLLLTKMISLTFR